MNPGKDRSGPAACSSGPPGAATAHPWSPPVGLPHRVAAPGEGLLDELVLPVGSQESSAVASVMDLAIEIAREGREGRRIGTIFTVGDHEAVLARSRCLILDPVAGHAAEDRSIHDPDARETIKELAQLDGGFVISTEGVIESACRYFESSLADIEPRLGLGTRHIAGASITRATRAVAVVVSQSSVVRLFHDGRLATEILPELWLLRRFIPHLSRPHLTEHPDENVAVFSPGEPPSGPSRPSPAPRSSVDP